MVRATSRRSPLTMVSAVGKGNETMMRVGCDDQIELVVVGICLALSGCSYVDERALDAVDVVDLKYGTGGGLGAKIEATPYIGPVKQSAEPRTPK